MRREVKEHDVAEAHRRLQGERDAQKDLNQLPTSGLEELRLEEEHDDTHILVKVGLCVNKRLEWAHTGKRADRRARGRSTVGVTQVVL